MDPTENLKRQLLIANGILDNYGAAEYDYERLASDGAQLANLILALNEWINKGGHMPKQWKDKLVTYY